MYIPYRRRATYVSLEDKIISQIEMNNNKTEALIYEYTTQNITFIRYWS